MTSARRYLPALDGLRGLAAIWVFALHLLDTGGHHWTPGYLGVDLFFVLSGFVLSHAYAGGLRTVPDYRRFLHARVARIYPLHLVTLLTMAGLVVLWPAFAGTYPDPARRFGWDAFLAQLLLVQNWVHFLPTSWNAPAWSLSAEWAAYLAFPAVLFAASRGRRPFALAMGCMATMLLVLVAAGAPGGGTGAPAMVRVAFGSLAGCLVHRAYVTGVTLPPLATTLAAATLLGIAHIPGLAMLGTLAFPPLVLLCARGEGALARLCATRLAVWVGVISYSLYLWHWIVIQVAARTLKDAVPMGVFYAVVALIVLAVSAASHAWLEKPARLWVLQLPGARRALPATR
ncbi:acyltransferase family protein [Falsiroseomonas oryzae]|uniref:acyltransferase family protein n=1 Tax=Falsiroseomonas oryzae TaxID=2766473 RepID=UPI0022EA2FE0|nr:acyltransferase [Roseomonas sp. MO-31]